MLWRCVGQQACKSAVRNAVTFHSAWRGWNNQIDYSGAVARQAEWDNERSDSRKMPGKWPEMALFGDRINEIHPT